MGQKPIARYATAVLGTGLALAVRVALEPAIGNRANFVTIFPAVVAVAWMLGLGPALAALATGALGATFFLLEPRHSLGLATFDDRIALGAFLLTGLFTALLAEAARAGRRRAEASAELALRRQHQLESVTDNTSVLLTQCSRDLRYVFVNRACEQFLGRPRDEIIGQEIRAVLGDAAFEAIRPHVERVLEGQAVEFESELPHAHAGTRFVHVRYVPDRGPDSEVCGWFASVTDVTDQKNAERVLREADRRKDEFLATLGHELRNPLAPIANAVRLLQAKGPPDAELKAARDMIERQVRQLARLIDDLLDISRITLGKLQLRSERVELAVVVASAVEAARGYLQSKGQELLVLLPPRPVWLEADPTRLAQVLSNLLDNAAKYSDAAGRITLGATVAERDGAAPRLRLSVRDQGIGIPAAFLPRLFEKFSQAAPSLERSQSGMGLGLALVRGLVEMHGGSVSARSEGPGRGSEFVVELPLADAPPAPVVPSARSEAGAAAAQRRILVVDDNRDSADSLAELLRLLGHDVAAAHGGLEAVAAAETYRPELVLMDIGMPGVDGYEACRLIREQPWGKPMVLVAQTGWGQEADRRRAREAGFDSHMVKPVDHEALGSLLASMPRRT